MLKFVIKRIIITIPVLLGVTFIIFTMMYFTPGDPARLILGETATDEEVIELRVEMGLDKPFLTQYFNYMNDLFHGDLGTSYTSKMPVMDELKSRLPVTAKLAFFVILFAIVIGIPAGILSAIRQYSILDYLTTLLALLGITMPNFWLALLLILLFAVNLGILPASGLYGPAYYIMPVLSISVFSVATITRMTRSSMLEVIRQDYIQTARSKGLSETKVIVKHALLNALIPIITVIGLQFSNGLGGAVVNESVFAIPGIGKLMVDAIKNRNYPVVQGGVLTIAVMFSLLNLLTDLVYAFVDPRIKTQYINSTAKKRRHGKDIQ